MMSCRFSQLHVPGLKSVAKARVTLEHGAGRSAGHVQRVARAGEHHGRGAGRAQGRDVVAGCVNEVVRRHGPELGGQRRPSGVGQLLGVDLQPEPQGAPGLEHAPRLIDREGALVAEHVDEVGLTGHRGQDLVNHVGDIVVVAARVLLGRQVRGQERIDAVDRVRGPGRGQQLAFVAEREPVPGLDLGRRGAVPEHRVEPLARQGGELVFARRTGGAHRRHDPSAGGLDLKVRVAGQAAAVLAGALAGEDGVGVGVDQTRHDGGSLGVDDGGVVGEVNAVAHIRLGPDPHDAPLRGCHRTPRYHAEPLRRAHRDELAGAAHQQIGPHRAPASRATASRAAAANRPSATAPSAAAISGAR
jgi:hypothetical protein